MELDDALEVRMAKILRIIDECRFGIHDISFAGLDPSTGFARFNMPLELGLLLACKHYRDHDPDRGKQGLILDSEPYRYQRFISDIAGQDIRWHRQQPEKLIHELRQWLRIVSRSAGIAGEQEIWSDYRRFRRDLNHICKSKSVARERLNFADLAEIAGSWLNHLKCARRRDALAKVRLSRGLATVRPAPGDHPLL